MEERKDERPAEEEIVQAEAGDDEESTKDEAVGEPEPEPKDPPLIGTTGWVVAAVAIGLVLVPASCPVMATSGASRSAQIVWQERQAEVARAVAQADAEATHGPAQGE